MNGCDLPIRRDALTALREKVDDYSHVPMQDVVRFWEAPYAGDEVSIKTHIKYLGDSYIIPDLDGLKLSIQTMGEVIWTDSIKPTKNNIYNLQSVDSASLSETETCAGNMSSL